MIPLLDRAHQYVDRGWPPIPVPYRSKSPTIDGWQKLLLTHETVPDYFNGQPSNIGVLLGEPAGGLIDIDLDVVEALSLADIFLPRTPCEFGRPSKPRSHRLYMVPAPVPETTKFPDIKKVADSDATAMILEFRSTGGQTVFPGSVHADTGEPIEFNADGNPAEVDGNDLLHRARLLAIAALLVRHWPAKGSRHLAVLASAGLLLRAKVEIAEVVAVLTSAARAVDPGADLKIVRSDVMATYDKLEANEEVTGGPALAELLQGDGGKVVKRIKKWLGIHRSAEPAWRPPADRPEIDTGNLGLVEMADAAWQAIRAANDPPRVFRYGTELAWLHQDPSGLPQIQVMQEDHVRHHLGHVATFTRWVGGAGKPPTKKPAFPPIALAKDLLAVPDTSVPPITRIVRVPVFTCDGRLLTEPGHDAASGIYFAPSPGLSIPDLSDAPTADDIAEARRWLMTELLGDFPFAADADRAHAAGLMLTLCLREMVPGDVPLTLISKPSPRTGAGLLTKVVSLVHDGRAPAVATLSRDEEEMRKRLTSFLLAAPAMLLLDNLHGRLDSPALAAILTSGGIWRDRVLGHTQEVQVPVKCAFVLTGNNPVLSTEAAGRSVLVRLDAKLEDPSTRTGFRHPDLAAWTLEHRGRLLWSLLTLGRAWMAAGRPRAKDTPFGGFEEWAAVLGGVLAVAGIQGFLANRRSLFEQADEEGSHIRAFLASWWREHRDTPMATRELVELAKSHELPLTARTEHGMLVKLGQLIKAIEDRQYSIGPGVVVAVRRWGTETDKAVLWRLGRESTESTESTESSCVNAYTGGGGTYTRIESTETDSANSVDSGETPPDWVTEDES